MISIPRQWMLWGNPPTRKHFFGVTAICGKFWAHALVAVAIGLLPAALGITGTAAWAAYRIIVPEFTQTDGE